MHFVHFHTEISVISCNTPSDNTYKIGKLYQISIYTVTGTPAKK